MNVAANIAITPEQRVRALLACIDRNDWRSLAEHFHDNIVYERPGYTAFDGKSRVMQFYRDERIIAEGTHHVDRVIVGDGTSACWGRFVGTSRKGEPLAVDFADIYGFEEGLIRTRRTYFFRPAV